MGIHRGEIVTVGGMTIHAAGASHLTQNDVRRIAPDVVIDLAAHRRFNWSLTFPPETLVIVNHLEDFGGVPHDWREFLEDVIAHLRNDKKVLVMCRGGHGRTGCLLGSLVALLEPTVTDPIAEVRSRYCGSAVESRAQGQAIFSLKNTSLPSQYRDGLW